MVQQRVYPAADIRKEFSQIRIRENKRDSLRFYWQKEPHSEIEVLRFTRALFGLISSPFLLAGVLECQSTRVPEYSSAKAPGPDEIPNWFLKTFSHLLAEPVCYLINSSFQKQVLPTIWKKANVIPLPKIQTIEEFNKDLRPISLTPTLSKIAEEYVVQEHVKPAVLKHIRPDQYGCVPFSSTKHVLIYLIHHSLEATDATGSEVRVILMDYKNASNRPRFADV